MVTAVANQDLVAPSKEANSLDGILVGFSTTECVEEGVQVAWHQFRQAQRKLCADFSGHAGVGVGERGGLILNGLDDFRVAMPDVHTHQLAIEIDPTLAFGTVEIDAFRTSDRHRINLASGTP